MNFHSARSGIIALTLAALVAESASAQTSAATPAAAPAEPDWTITGNVGIYSQYVFRGIAQTNEKPALQGGFDLAHKSGGYAGTWLSNVSWISDGNPDASASVEWDLYGGFKFPLANDFTLDLGALYYYYPGRYPPNFTKPDTLELYAGISWKFLSAKYSYSVDNKTFGLANSRGSDYLELNATYDVVEKVSDVIGKVTVYGHIGKQRFENNGFFNYTDWKVGAATEIYGVTAGVFVTGTDGEAAAYTNRFGRDTSDTQFVAYVQKTF